MLEEGPCEEDPVLALLDREDDPSPLFLPVVVFCKKKKKLFWRSCSMAQSKMVGR